MVVIEAVSFEDSCIVVVFDEPQLVFQHLYPFALLLVFGSQQLEVLGDLQVFLFSFVDLLADPADFVPQSLYLLVEVV